MKDAVIYLPEEFSNLSENDIACAKRHAENFAKYVKGIDESDPKYLKVVEKEMINYLEEGVRESLTPHMMNPIKKAQNRTTPIAIDAFEDQPYFSFNGPFFTGYVANKDEREQLYRTLRSSVNTLAFIYMKAALKLDKKDFEFPEGAGPDVIRTRVLNRYKRAFFVSSIMALLEPLFQENPQTLSDEIEKKISEFGVDLMKSDTREQFLRFVRNKIVKDGYKGMFK